MLKPVFLPLLFVCLQVDDDNVALGPEGGCIFLDPWVGGEGKAEEERKGMKINAFQVSYLNNGFCFAHLPRLTPIQIFHRDKMSQ